MGKECDTIKSRRNDNFKKHRPSPFEKLENIVFNYVCSMNNFNGTLTGATLKKAGEEVCKWLNKRKGPDEDVLEFQASNGWEYRFKQRFSLKSWRRFGEAGSASAEGIELARTAFPKVLAALKITRPENVFNLDETGLRWLTPPDQTIAAHRPIGYKKAMDRITVMVCCNATGTSKRSLFVVGKSENPLSFRRTNIKKKCWYRHYHSAWMTVKLFNEWLEDFNQRMRDQRRTIVLCMDNCSAHRVSGAAGKTLRQVEGLDVVTLSHIHVVYLPKNTTSAVQPADQGIIRCLKADYKRNLVEFQWQAFMEMKTKAEAGKKEHMVAVARGLPTCEPPPFKAYLSKVKPSLHTAVTWCIEGWKSMPPSVIANCWRHAGILPAEWPATGASTSDCDNPPIAATTGGPSDAAGGSSHGPISALQLLNLAYMATNDMLDAMRPELPDLMHAQEFTENTPDEDFSEESQSAEEFASGLLNSLEAEEDDEADAVDAAAMAAGVEDVSQEELEASLETLYRGMVQREQFFGEKHMSAIYQIRQHYKRQKLHREINKVNGQSTIRDFFQSGDNH